MGKISVEFNNDELVITRYESKGSVIPTNISQEVRIVAIINDNLDVDDVDISDLPKPEVVATRMNFIRTMLSKYQVDQKYKDHCSGLYSRKDMDFGITWAEVAYMIYFVLEREKNLDWNSIRPEKDLGVCVLKEDLNGVSVLTVNIGKYKSKTEMEVYVHDMACGKRYIPLPLYCAFVEFLNSDLSDNCNIQNVYDMFNKMTKAELVLFNDFDFMKY